MDVSVNQNEAVNNQAPAESAPAANQPVGQNPPQEGNPVGQEAVEKHIPYDRFKQVIDERNQERVQREAAESRLRDLNTPRLDPTRSEVEKTVQNYVAAGLSEQAARILVDNQLNLVRSQQVELKNELHGYKVNEWTRELKEQFKDYAEVSGEADKQFSSMSPQEQMEVMGSRRSLHTFFKSVRSDLLDKKLSSSYAAGADNAYKNQQLKQGMGNVPGKGAAAPSGAITREELTRLANDPAAFAKRLPEINEALKRGLIK